MTDSVPVLVHPGPGTLKAEQGMKERKTNWLEEKTHGLRRNWAGAGRAQADLTSFIQGHLYRTLMQPPAPWASRHPEAQPRFFTLEDTVSQKFAQPLLVWATCAHPVALVTPKCANTSSSLRLKQTSLDPPLCSGVPMHHPRMQQKCC